MSDPAERAGRSAQVRDRLRAAVKRLRAHPRDRLRAALGAARPALTAIAAALALGAGLIAAVGADPIAAYAALIDGALAGKGLHNLHATLNRAAMIAGAALAAGLALRAGRFNIGVEGQMVLGAVAAALTALHLPASPPLVTIAAAVAAGMLAGGLWALLGEVLEQRAQVPLLIGTLLLNYPADALASWLVGHPFRDRMSGMAASARLPAELRIDPLGDTHIYIAVPAVALVAVLLSGFFQRTVWGYEARMTGLAPLFARASGLHQRRQALAIMFASGALAGFIGALAVVGEHHRYIDGMLTRPLYAWTGIMAVLLGGYGPGAAVAASLFFGGLHAGATGMERAASVPREIARVVLACVILLVAARGQASAQRRRDKPSTDPAPPADPTPSTTPASAAPTSDTNAAAAAREEAS
ncbi:MAG: ABC transporter permease [Haliangiales bacterium]